MIEIHLTRGPDLREVVWLEDHESLERIARWYGVPICVLPNAIMGHEDLHADLYLCRAEGVWWGFYDRKEGV